MATGRSPRPSWRRSGSTPIGTLAAVGGHPGRAGRRCQRARRCRAGLDWLREHPRRLATVTLDERGPQQADRFLAPASAVTGRARRRRREVVDGADSGTASDPPDRAAGPPVRTGPVTCGRGDPALSRGRLRPGCAPAYRRGVAGRGVEAGRGTARRPGRHRVAVRRRPTPARGWAGRRRRASPTRPWRGCSSASEAGTPYFAALDIDAAPGTRTAAGPARGGLRDIGADLRRSRHRAPDGRRRPAPTGIAPIRAARAAGR